MSYKEIPAMTELIGAGSDAKLRFRIHGKRFWLDWGSSGWNIDLLPRITLILWSDDHDLILSWGNWFFSFSWEPSNDTP